MRKGIRISGLLIFAVAVLIALWIPRAHTGVTAQSQHTTHRDRKHMHMKNWLLEPTGIAGVTPVDPASIPKYVTQLTKPPVHVAVGTQTDPESGKKIPRYEVTAKVIQAQLLPDGYPTTKAYAYGGLVNFNPTGQRPDEDIRTAFTMPGPTFEAVRDQRFFVHYINQLDGDLIFPNDPTIMGANVNNAPIPTAPFKHFPPGYKDFQSPIPTVAHFHGGVTPSASAGFPESWFTINEGKKGPTFTSSTFEYYNAQLATTLWYHDHTLGNYFRRPFKSWPSYSTIFETVSSAPKSTPSYPIPPASLLPSPRGR